MSRSTDRQKLSLFGPLVENRSEDDEEAPDEDSTTEKRRPDAIPYFRHR